ncbi:hypothetical protein ABPG75_011546 [Micractinium tetrahymenae]
MMDAIVVGGGPSGLATAHAVIQARPGARVAVMERSDLRPRGATFGVCPNGMRALEAIRPELKQALMQHHCDYEQRVIYDRTGTRMPSPPGDSGKTRILQHGEYIQVAWHSLQSTLAEALPPGTLHTGHRFLGYSESSGGVAAQFETAQGVRTIEAGVLIGADGGQSAVRQALLGDGPPQFLGMAIWRAVRPRPAGWTDDHAVWGGIGQSIMVTALQGDLLCWQAFRPWPADKLHLIGGRRQAYIQENDGGSAAQQDGVGSASPSELGAERIRRCLDAFNEWPPHVLDLVATTDPLSVTEHGQFFRDPDTCQAYARGCVALVGDAAHLGTPMLSQGCSQALEDALELGRAIGQFGPTPEALAAYEAVRVPAASEVQRWSFKLLRQFQQGQPGPSEVDVNIDQGFIKRQHAPLVPAVTARSG